MASVFKIVAKNPRENALLMLLLDSGITLSEVEVLTDSDVDTADGTVRVFRRKTQRERYAYFSPPTADAIEKYRFSRPDPIGEPRLFLTRDGYPLIGGRIQKVLERVGRKAGIGQRLSPHKLRHSFATWSLKYGSNLEYIRIVLGHSDIRTTSRSYLHMANSDVATAFKKTSPIINLGIRRGAARSPGKMQGRETILSPLKVPRGKQSRHQKKRAKELEDEPFFQPTPWVKEASIFSK
ncbi:tyrosine-type recombinase/integrase [Chloroflexota bacterium]